MNVTPPVEIAAFLACAYFVVALFNALARAWFTVRGKPSPIEQQQATQGISERVGRIEVCQCEQARRLGDVEDESRRMRALLGSEIDKVFNRVNAVADSTATMAGEMGVIRSQLAALLERSRR